MADQDIPFIDDEISRLPGDIREDLAERGRNDLYFFAKAVMGYQDMTPGCHKALCRFHDENKERIKLTMMPRGHYKTSTITIAKTAQKVVKNPNERILVVNEVADNAENFLSAIRQNAENNKVFRALYSEVIPKTSRKGGWSGKELLFNRTWHGPEPTISAMGMTSALTSRHYTHLNWDDPISEEAVKSPTVMQDAITRMSKWPSLMVRPEEDTMDIVGTRWALHDIYSWFMNQLKGKMALFIRAAIKDGQPIFPELMSLEGLSMARELYGEYMFSCLYMNNPRDIANQDFNIQDLKFWRWAQDGDMVVLYNNQGEIEREWPVAKLDINVSVDLAMSEKITDDRNAIVTTGTTPDGRVIVLDVWVKRCTPLDVIEQLFWLKHRYWPRQFGIESVAYQKSFKYFLRAEAERRNEYLNIVDLKAIPSKRGQGNNSKEMRIRGLQPLAASGRLYILPTQHSLRNEMADFPLGEHDDTLDALAHQLTMWRGIVGQERMKKYKEAEKALLARINSGYQPVTDDDLEFRPSTQHQSLEDLGIEVPHFGKTHDFIFDS